jgi:hypothetical protein
VEVAWVDLEGVAVSRSESETLPGDCTNESCFGFSVSGEDQKLGHRIASACLVAVRKAAALKNVGKSTPEGHGRQEFRNLKALKQCVKASGGGAQLEAPWQASTEECEMEKRRLRIAVLVQPLTLDSTVLLAAFHVLEILFVCLSKDTAKDGRPSIIRESPSRR